MTKDLSKCTIAQLKERAEELGLTIKAKSRKQEIIDLLLEAEEKSSSSKDASSQEENQAEETENTPKVKTPKRQERKSKKREVSSVKGDEQETQEEAVSLSRDETSSERFDHSVDEGEIPLIENKAEDSLRRQERGLSQDQSEKNQSGHLKTHRNPQEQAHQEKDARKGRRFSLTERKKTDRYSKIKDDITKTIMVSGPLTVHSEGFGFVDNDGAEAPYDTIYVSASQIQKFRLKTGDVLGGKVRPPKSGEKYAAMLFLEIVNGTETKQLIEDMDQMLRSTAVDSDERFQESHSGILDVNPDGYGFMRTKNYQADENDIYVAANQIRRYGLATGDRITGKIRKSGEGDHDALLYVESVNGELPEKIVHRPKFENLLPVFPEERITLETKGATLSTRMIDLFSPIGKGQRGMIVAPPKAGKTTLLKDIARGIRHNHPEIELIILLVDERPEEVTDMRRSIDCDIVSSTFDQPAQNHLAVAQMVLERGKRLVEQGKDVVILVDSLTRLTRANNLCVEPSGRTLSGGIDPESLYFPKKFFGSARNIEDGGSLTIIATALVETGSRMDDIIYEEFKGTGNMELQLERELAERRIYPALNLLRSGTRREDKLLDPKEMKASYAIRKMYGGSAVQMTDKVITALNKTQSNEEFLSRFIKE